MVAIEVVNSHSVSHLTDHTDLIQQALDSAFPGDVVRIPENAAYNIDALRSLRPRTGTHLVVDGILRALPNNKDNSHVILVDGVKDVGIGGKGKIIGERTMHTGTQGPEHSHGHGVAIFNSSNVTVTGITASACSGDGFYVQGCKAVTLNRVQSLSNKRSGLSIVAVEGMTVVGSTFGYQNGPSPMPQAGINIEPDVAAQNLIDIYITQNQFVRNKGAGVYIAFEPSATRRKVSVFANTFDQHYKDGSGPCIGGRNTPLCNFLYATCRWMPGYDWWGFPKEFVAP